MTIFLLNCFCKHAPWLDCFLTSFVQSYRIHTLFLQTTRTFHACQVCSLLHRFPFFEYIRSFFWGEYNTRCLLVERITIVEVNSQIFLPPPSSCLLLFFVCRLICALDYFGKVKFPYLLYMPLENENGVQEMPIVHIDFVAYTQTFHT